ncbi:MAG: metallophosphoesterase [Polyangiaceae bacterium]|nr:metallophosphoesterase [Polyangiaceae bacterium]
MIRALPFVLAGLAVTLASGCGTDSAPAGSGNAAQDGGGTSGGGAGGGTAGTGGAAGGGGGGGTPHSDAKLVFAALGDSGFSATDDLGITKTKEVAALVNSWDLDFILHLGDLNYPDGAATTIEANIGRHYARHIWGYQGPNGPGADVNRFFPCPGNHDYKTDGAQPYFDYFPFLEQRHHYDVDFGLLHVFSLDSETDAGRDASSPQGQWLLSEAPKSGACFKLAMWHRASYTSGKYHDSPNEESRFVTRASTGVDLVLYGHDHVYERVEKEDTVYLTVGTGGAGLYDFEGAEPDSKARYRGYGALLVTVTPGKLVAEFRDLDGNVQDSRTIEKTCP